MTAIGATASDAETIAKLRALPEIKFSTESSAAYHVEKHIDDLPPSEANLTTPATRVQSYLESAAKTVKTGTAVTGANQDGTPTVAFTRTVTENHKAYTLTARVFLTEDGNAFLATYGGGSQ